MPHLELVSHRLCPYVQRAVIALAEKKAPATRTYVDLANKPDWLLALSPTGKVPVLRVEGRHAIFESAVICDYLDETVAPRLHPEYPLLRAKHRAWIEYASAVLNDIWGYYTAPDEAAFVRKGADLAAKFAWLEAALGEGPYFAGARFSLVDAAFAPVFRYFDVFERVVDSGLFAATPKLRAWRAALAARPSVREAVPPEYPDELAAFVRAQNSHLGRLLG